MLTIKSKKLFSYLNPFEDILPGQDRTFNKQIITNLLRQSDIYNDPQDDFIINQSRKIAYLISHPENLFVKLNVPTNQEDLKTMLVNENDNILAFVALSYLNPQNISVDLEGDKKFAKTFFEVSSKEPLIFSSEAIKCNNEFPTIRWVVNENLLVESWRDKEFVLKNLNAENIHLNYKLVPEEFWQDGDFFENFMKKFNSYNSQSASIFNYALKHHKYNEYFLKYVVNHHNSFSIFKENYYKDFIEYKKGNVSHPNQFILENLISKPSTLYRWLRSLYNSDIIKNCFSKETLESTDTILEWYKASLTENFTEFNPLLERNYSGSDKLLPFVLEQSKEWRITLFESLVDTFLNHTPQGKHNNKTFNNNFSSLLFNSINISNDFLPLIKDFNSNKQNIYMQSFDSYCRASKDKPFIGKDLSDFILSHFPQYFELLGTEYRTLENFKKMNLSSIVSMEEIIKFSDKELNLKLIKSGYSNKVIEAFPLSYLKDEDYLLALINEKSYFVSTNKSVIKFIESNLKLSKAFIDKGWFSELSPKIFENLELGSHLIGRIFSKSSVYSSCYQDQDKIKSMVNPIVFSNIDCLRTIIEISEGYFLTQAHNLFNHKPFVQMVFSLYDNKKITEIEYLPPQVRLILDSYQVKENFESFFIKYELQTKLEHKLIENKPSTKLKNKI